MTAKGINMITSNEKLDSQLRKKILNICHASRFCGLCLNTNNKLMGLDSKLIIPMGCITRKEILANIIDYIFRDLNQETLFSPYICICCMKKSVQSYIFIYNSEHISKVLRTLINDLYNKTECINKKVLKTNEDSKVLIVLEADHVLNPDIVETREEADLNQNRSHIAEKIDLHSDVEICAIIDKENSQNDSQLSILKNICRRKAILNGKFHPETYKCNKCKEILPSYIGWKKHYKLCKKKKKYKCKICCESFITQTSLNSHYKKHSKARCKVCSFFIPLEDLTEHMKINHEDYIYLCKLCKFYTFNNKTLEQHTAKAHSGSMCALCFKKVQESKLKLHKCKFTCLECTENICIHYKYLMSYKEQIKNNVTKFKCLDCDYIYHRREALLSHVNREHLNHHPFTCAHCYQQFYSKITLKYHLNTYHKEHFICEFCDQKFNMKSILINHIDDCQTRKRNYQCDQCSSSFNFLEELTIHIKVRHDKEIIDCNLCEKKFLSSIKLQIHNLKVHSGLQMKRMRSILNCPICKIHCISKKKLMQHIKIHGTNIKYPCAECLIDFKNVNKLHAHMRLHYEDVIQCESCNKVLTTTFYPHHKLYCKKATSENEVMTCETCGKTYHSEKQLQMHRRHHIDKIPCDICGKMTKPFYMKYHIKHVHGETSKNKKASKRKTPYRVKCKWCNHVMYRLAELETHVNRFHLKIKPYKCDYCKKTFFGKERLKCHMITHTSSKVVYCSVCNKKFQNNVCLKIHMRLHTGYNPYNCDMCGERFRTSSMLNTHKIKKHTEKSVSCPLCDSMFHMIREMRMHFKKVHWKQKGKPFDPQDVKELKPEFYSLFHDGRLPTID
ncbi:hypothetical protein ACJJTC_000284 [Scirpophaga incertulas]